MAALTTLLSDILFDCSRRFNTYSNINLIITTNDVINDVTKIVPIDLNV